MTQENYFNELKNEFMEKLNRELCREELEFIAMVTEKYMEDLYHTRKARHLSGIGKENDILT